MAYFIRIFTLVLLTASFACAQTDTLPGLNQLLLKVNTVDSAAVRPDSTYWTHKFQTGVNLNQGSFSRNWTGGGVNSVALGLLLNGNLSYRRNRISWTTTLQLQYGIVKNEAQTVRKSTDRIFFDAKGGYRISRQWQWFASLNLLSQFAPGYNYTTLPSGDERRSLISNLFAPAYITESIGLTFEPSDKFDLRLGLLTLRETIVRDTNVRAAVPQNYGVPLNRISRTELAFQMVANYDHDFAKNMNMRLRYQFFANYRNPLVTAHRIDATLTAKINELVNANLSGVFLYDQDQDVHIQYSQALALGLLLTL